MKKKLIESMDAPKIPKGKKGIFGIARMPAEDICTIDIVDSKSKSVLVRIAFSEKEWMNYFPEKGTWNGKQIKNVFSEDLGEVSRNEYYGLKVINIKYLEKVCHTESISTAQYMISSEKREKAIDARRERCKQRNSEVRELTQGEEDFLYRYIRGFHFIYYKRSGRKVDLTCSACGKTGTFYTEIFEPYEFNKWLSEKPVHNAFTDCPMCNKRVQYKAAEKTQGVFEKRDARYIVQKYGNGLVVRYFEPNIMISGEIGHATETYNIPEIARVFFVNGKEQKDFHKYNPWSGKNFWDDCNLAGMSNIVLKTGKVYRGNFEEIKETSYKYACIEDEIINSDYVDIIQYIETYNYMPAIEILHKLGMTKLKKYAVAHGRWSGLFNPSAKNGPDVLKITKQRFNDMRQLNGDERLLRVFQYEKTNNKVFTEKEIDSFVKHKLDVGDLDVLLRYATLTKLINYMDKQKDRTWSDYKDYIRMCENNNRDMTNPNKVYPRNLGEAHQRELRAYSIMKEKITLEEKNKKNPNIKKDAAEYNRRYKFQDEKYIIRAPKDAAEIVMEGVLLDHCVGRMGYIESMNRKETVILFLRKKSDRKIPYYTLEVKEGKIRQAYGKGDKKPDWEEVKPFIDAFEREKLGTREKEERKVG